MILNLIDSALKLAQAIITKLPITVQETKEVYRFRAEKAIVEWRRKNKERIEKKIKRELSKKL